MSERQARLTLTLLAASFAVLIVGLVVFFSVRSIRQGDNDGRESPSPVIGAEGSSPVFGGLGPLPGADLAAYTESRREALASATGDRVAVVSLTAYMAENRARATVGGAEVLALLAAPPGGQPSVVIGDLDDWVASHTAEARAERDELQKLIPTVTDDPTFESFYRAEVDRLNAVISGISVDGDLIFAVVVRAPATVLRDLADNADVRLVDVSGGDDAAAEDEYRGIRPEETETVNEPSLRPL
ncbi:MAG: hypothetical protein ABR540_22660 [Acidimicrobiales bacterium]